METSSDSPVSTRHWGLLDVLVGFVCAVVASMIVGLVIVEVGGYEADLTDAPFWVFFAAQVPFWLVLFATVVNAGQRRGAGVVPDFTVLMQPGDVWRGLLWGVLAQVVLVPLLYVPILQVLDDEDVSEQARELTDRLDGAFDQLLFVVMVVVIAPVVEELFFRGLTLRALERRWGMGVAVVVSALFFAAVHFQLLQFPALVLIGVICALLVRSSGRLGPAIWAHVGFNGVTALALLALEDRVVAHHLVDVTTRLVEQGSGTV